MSNNKTPRILLASNSQGTSVGVSQEQNYPSILQEKLGPEFEVHRILISGWTLRDLFNNLTDNVLSIDPDLVVMHFGIIESAQRILSNWEKRLLLLLPLGGKVSGFLHRNRSAVLRIRHSLGIQARQVTLHEYSDTVRSVVACLDHHKISHLFLRTPSFSDGGTALNHPFIDEDVETYNAVLDKYESVAIETCVAGWTMNDYQFGTVHFSKTGHEKVATLLFNEITSRLP